MPTSPGPGTSTALSCGTGTYLHNIYTISTQYLHRFVEAAKFGYAGRTEMGDWHSPEIRQMMEDMIR